MNKETAVNKQDAAISEEQKFINAEAEMWKAITALKLEFPPEIVNDLQDKYSNLLKYTVAGRRQG
jgi:hypothetical protein